MNNEFIKKREELITRISRIFYPDSDFPEEVHKIFDDYSKLKDRDKQFVYNIFVELGKFDKRNYEEK